MIIICTRSAATAGKSSVLQVLGDPAKDQLEVDQAALTGESLPVQIFAGEMIKMGSTIKRGDLDAVVCFTGPNTFFGNAAALVASVNLVGRFQKVLFRAGWSPRV